MLNPFLLRNNSTNPHRCRSMTYLFTPHSLAPALSSCLSQSSWAVCAERHHLSSALSFGALQLPLITFALCYQRHPHSFIMSGQHSAGPSSVLLSCLCVCGAVTVQVCCCSDAESSQGYGTSTLISSTCWIYCFDSGTSKNISRGKPANCTLLKTKNRGNDDSLSIFNFYTVTIPG